MQRNISGFTIVELLIVIVVIAVLATISIVTYNGIQDRARTTSALSAAKQASEKLAVYAAENSDQYPENLTTIGIASNSGATYSYTINAARTAYCLTASTGEKHARVSNTSGTPREGSCSGHGSSTTPELALWSMTSGSGITYDSAANEFILVKGTTGTYQSPLIDAADSVSVRVSYEIFATTASTYHTPNSGGYTGAVYFAADGTTPATNTSGHQGNGHTAAVTLGSWQPYTAWFATGPNVKKLSVTINSGVYTSDMRIRNVSITINR